MFRNVIARLQQGHRTIEFPKAEPTMPDRFRGRPVVDRAKCPVGCRDCAEACPTDAITLRGDLARARVRFAEGQAPVSLQGGQVWTRYYSPGEFYRIFARRFELRACQGLNLFLKGSRRPR